MTNMESKWEAGGQKKRTPFDPRKDYEYDDE